MHLTNRVNQGPLSSFILAVPTTKLQIKKSYEAPNTKHISIEKRTQTKFSLRPLSSHVRNCHRMLHFQKVVCSFEYSRKMQRV